MTDEQLRELATLQGAYYKAVEDQDTSEQHEKLVLIIYWIRQQIWQEARLTIVKISLDDFERFGIDQVQLPASVLARFGDFQASMLQALQGRVDTGKELWGQYLDWVSDLIDANVSAHTSKYVKVIARQIKKR